MPVEARVNVRIEATKKKENISPEISLDYSLGARFLSDPSIRSPSFAVFLATEVLSFLSSFEISYASN